MTLQSASPREGRETTMDDEHTYQEPHPSEGFLYVREWEDHRLMDEHLFLSRLYHAVCMEVGFRADYPEERDDTGDISAADIAAYELADEITDILPNLEYND